MIWVVFAFLNSMLRAVQSETNRVFKASGWALAFWQAFFGLLFLLPLLPYVLWTDDPDFYLAAIGVSLIFTVGTLIQMNLSGRSTGRISCISGPVEAVTAAGLWMVFSPSFMRDHVVGDPLITVAVVVAFLMACLGAFRIRPGDVNIETLMVALPVGLTYAVAGVVAKIAFPAYDFAAAVLTFVMIKYMVMVCVMGPVFLLKEKTPRALMRPEALKAGAVSGIVSVLAFSSFVAAVVMAPNPGYVGVTAMLLPVWLTVWHGATGKEDTASRLAALFIAIAVVMLAVAG